MKNIAVIIQSRDRVAYLKKCINMLYRTCFDTNNFDIICVVDIDQKGLYNTVKEEFPEIKWLYPEHQESDWTNLVKIQHDFVRENDYYFIWAVCDDFQGVSPNWDQSISYHKGVFPDDIFTIHSSSNVDVNAQKSRSNCYHHDDDLVQCGWKIYQRTCERLPVNTKKWIELMSPFLMNKSYCNQHELITASLALLLKYHYGIKRVVTIDGFYWTNLEDTGGSLINERGKIYEELYNKKFVDLMPIAEQMRDKILESNKVNTQKHILK